MPESFPMESVLDEAYEADDREAFARAFSIAASEPAGTLLPLCDVCSRDAVLLAEERLYRLRAEEEHLSEFISTLPPDLPKVGSSEDGAASGHGSRSADQNETESAFPLGSALQDRLGTGAAEDGAVSNVGDGLDELTDEELLNVLAEETAQSRELQRRRERVDALAERVKAALADRQHEAASRHARRVRATASADLSRLAVRRRRALLEELSGMSILSEMFRVYRMGRYVAISGCRLGAASAASGISLAEQNAALGRLATMVSTVTTRMGVPPSKYQVVPMGSTSFLTRTAGTG